MAKRLSSAERRDRILETAMEIITQEGYRGLTMRSVARRCDLSAPGLMHYFPSMPALLMGVLDHRDKLDQEAMETDLGPEANIRDVMTNTIENMLADPSAARLFATLETESLHPNHPAHRYFKVRNDHMVRQLLPYLEGEYDQPKHKAQQVLAILNGLQIHWLRDLDDFDLMEHWQQIADVLLPD